MSEKANEETIAELEDEAQGEVRVGRLITSVARALATGLALTPGLFLLFASSAVELVGVNAITSTVLVTIVSGLTLLNVLELLGGSSTRGGTSALVYESMGAFGGFLTGWTLPAIVLFFVSITVLLLSDLPTFDSTIVQKARPFEMGDILRVAAMMTITYAGFEAVMASRRRIQDQECPRRISGEWSSGFLRLLPRMERYLDGSFKALVLEF